MTECMRRDNILRKENERLRELLKNAGICLACGTERQSQARDGSYCPQCEPEKNPRLVVDRDPDLVPRWPWSELQ